MKSQAECIDRELLLALVGYRAEQQDAGRLLSLLRQVQWSHLLATTSQDLYPFLAFQLERCSNPGCVEASSDWEPLSRARRFTAIHNLRLRHEFRRIVEALDKCAIPALALKGIVLAYTTYPDPSLRPMSDLDLLVPPAMREQAVLVLQKLGFEYPEWVIATHRDHSWRLKPEQEYAPPLQLRGSSVLVEVHSQLDCGTPLFPIPTEQFWSRAVAVDIMGLKARSLCPEDSLFHLCLHQSHSHRFEKGLLPLIDLRFLIESYADWDWPGIAARSIRCGCAAWMHLTLAAARDLAGTPVPDIFFDALPYPAGLWTLRRLAEDQIWAARTGLSTVPGVLHRLLVEPSWRGRTRILFARTRLVAREEVEPKLTLSGLVRRARLSHRRLSATLRMAIRRYFRAWKKGQLRPEAIHSTTQQLRRANMLSQLVAEQEASWPDGKVRAGRK